jgi:hypothetical protein
MIEGVGRRINIQEDGDGPVWSRPGNGLELRIAVISSGVRTMTPTGFPAWACRRFSSASSTFGADCLAVKTTLPLAM